MPRPKCPQCGAPLQGGFFRTVCEYCGAKLNASIRAWRDLAVSTIPILVIIVCAAPDARRGSDPFRFFFTVVSQVAALLFVIVERYGAAPEHRPRILGLFKVAERGNGTVAYRAPEAPTFEAPKSWQSILSAPPPRKLKSGPVVSISLEFFGFAAFLAIWIWIFSSRYAPRGGRWLAVSAVFLTVAMIYRITESIREKFRSWRLLRDGDVAVGWVSDTWDSGVDHRKLYITVTFRDSVGRRFERDFLVRNADGSLDPGHAELVFYDRLNAEDCTAYSATGLRLAEAPQSLSAVRVE